MPASSDLRPARPPRFGLAARVVVALGCLLAATAAVMLLVVVPDTAGTFARHGEGLLRDGSAVMRDLARQHAATSSTVLVDLIRHTTTARQRTLQDLPLELHGGDVDAIRAAIAAADEQRSQRQQTNVEVLAREMERRAGATIDARLGELAARQRDQTVAFGSNLRSSHLTLVGAVAVALVLVFGFGVHALVVRPTRRLRRAVRRVADGDLDVELPAPSRDELGDLARDFAAMVRQLRDSRSELRRLNTSLEDEVRRKTLHLEQALADLRSSHRQLAEAERLAALGTLAGGIAHEFHNLIGGIRGCAAELATDETSPDRRETFAVIARAADRAAGIVHQLLRFARRSVDQIADVDVRTIVDDALRLCEPAARRQNVRVERVLGAPARVRADADGLHQVMVNLLTNALQAMPGGGTLTVAVRTDDAGSVVLSVADTGHGIAPADLPHVFEPFFTTKGAESDPARRGSGLGLSVSYGIVAAHGGRITVRSTVGEGAEFSVVLPRPPAG